MSTSSIVMLASMVCFIAGSLLTNWAWKRVIREKADSGFRLEVDGALYNVTEDQP